MKGYGQFCPVAKAAEIFCERWTVIRLDFIDQPSGKRRWWFINEAGEAHLCAKDPGFEVDLYLSVRLPDMIHIWRGDLSLSLALEAGRLETHGPSRLRRALPAWLTLSPFACVRSVNEDAQQGQARESEAMPPNDPTRALEALAAHLCGQVLLPGKPDYDATRRIWNGMIDRYPKAIARCMGACQHAISSGAITVGTGLLLLSKATAGVNCSVNWIAGPCVPTAGCHSVIETPYCHAIAPTLGKHLHSTMVYMYGEDGFRSSERRALR